jgi:DNA-binding beta-propeller fold protein YncE
MVNTASRHDSDPSASCGSCAPCDIGPFARNNYFTGKLLLERDFSDEQEFMLDKMRHHNRRLHGWGVVCGLKVHEHPTPGCRDRFICIEPGTALDCCGHELVVRDEDCFDITTLPAIQALQQQHDDALHTIQICLRYRECGSEPIPVLYDECGCDDTRCLPNRILESYEIDAVVDAPPTTAQWNGPNIVRGTDIGFADAQRVRFDAANDRLYVVAGTTVHAVDAASRAILASHDLTTAAHGLDISPSGTHVYAVHDDGAGGLTLSVLDATDLTVVHESAVPGGAAPAVSAVSPAADGRFLVLFAGSLVVYASDLESAAPTAPVTHAVPAAAELLALSSDGSTAYVAGAATLATVDVASGNVDPALGALLPAVAPTSLGATDVAGTAYVVLGTSDGNLHVLGTNPAQANGPVALDAAAVGFAGAPWIYALETAGGASRIQAVSPARTISAAADAVGPALGFQGDAHDLAITPDGNTLYVAYSVSAADPGGIAVFTVDQGDCAELLWKPLDGCNDCDDPNCVVLATITGYQPGFTMRDATQPPTDPGADRTAGIARIDNRRGRQLLPSTAVLTEVVECLLEHGAAGAPGPAGPKGDTGGKGDKGDAGPGLEANLVRISAISWLHAQPMSVSDLSNIRDGKRRRVGVMIAFSDEVHVDRIDANIFEVDALDVRDVGTMIERGYACRCPVRGQVVPIDPTIVGDRITEGKVVAGATTAVAVAFVFEDGFVRSLRELEQLGPEWQPWSDVRIRLRGDFVLDLNDPPRAIDAEYVRAELPSGDRPHGSEFGIQGGLFESWFQPGTE